MNEWMKDKFASSCANLLSMKRINHNENYSSNFGGKTFLASKTTREERKQISCSATIKNCVFFDFIIMLVPSLSLRKSSFLLPFGNSISNETRKKSSSQSSKLMIFSTRKQ